MKNVILASLLFIGIGNAFGVTIEKNYVSIKYEKCLKYRTIKFELPYCIKITNLSNKPIIVGPSIISAPLVTYQDIAKAIRTETKFFGGFFTLGAVTLGSMSWYLSKNWRVLKITILPGGVTRQETRTPWEVKLYGLASGAIGILGTYLLYKLLTETQKALEAKLAKETLHAPITIQPGESIEKLFWLKNPKDQIEIDFEAVKVLKQSL